MPKKTTTESSTTTKEDLNIAITKLILDLKGDGTVSSLEKLTGVPRKTLSLALRTCQEMEEERMSWDEYCEMKQKEKPPEFPPTTISWELTSLIKVADAMGIRVSKLISEAEEMQGGLPPWFKKRIKHLATPQTKEEFNNIFLEAVGCRTYSNSPAESLDITGKRKSLRGSSKDVFSYDDIFNLRFIADSLFESLEKAEHVFIKEYKAGVISPQNVYFILKNAIESMCRFFRFKPIPLHRRWRKNNEEEDRRIKTKLLIEFLRRNKHHLIDFTNQESRPFLPEEAKK